MTAADQPLTVLIQPSRALQMLLLGLELAALMSAGAWAVSSGAWVGGGTALLCTAALCAWAWHRQRQPSQALGWDGQQWWLAHTLEGRDAPHWHGSVRLAWRLGGCWVLRGQSAQGGIWLSVDERALGPQAHALLCALYCARPRRQG